MQLLCRFPKMRESQLFLTKWLRNYSRELLVRSNHSHALQLLMEGWINRETVRIVEAEQIAIQAFKVCPMIFRVLFTDEVVCRRGARVPRLALNASSYMHESVMMVVIIIPSFFSTSRLSSVYVRTRCL